MLIPVIHKLFGTIEGMKMLQTNSMKQHDANVKPTVAQKASERLKSVSMKN